MKDLLVSLIEYIFARSSNEEITLKRLLITSIKVIIFLVITALGLWIALQLKKT